MVTVTAAELATQGNVFGDLLKLNLDARHAIVNSLRASGSLCAARLSCKDLSAFIDGETTELRLRRLDVDTPSRCAGGNWMQVWPQASRFRLEVGEEDFPALATLLAGAPPAACGTVKCLELACIDDYITVPADALSCLLSSLPMLQTFTLRSGLAEEGSPLAHAQVAASLSSLSHLTALTLEDYGWLPCIQPGLTERLTELYLGGAASDAAPPCRALLAGAVASMPALQVLCLGQGACLEPAELRAVLDALQPSVRSFTAREVRLCHHADGQGAVTCELVGGELASVTIAQGRMCCKFHAADLAAFLEAALLPSRALGPRLPSLSLDLRLTPGLHGEATATAPAFGPGALDLLSRCDTVRLSALEANGCPPGAVLEVARLLGAPDRLQWGVAVRLRAPASQRPAASGEAQGSCNGGIEGSCNGGIEGSCSGNSTGCCAPREAPWVLRRALQAITAVGAHVGSEPEGPLGGPEGHFLLHGPALAQLAASPPALHAWAQQLNAELSSRHAPPGPGSAAPCGGHSTAQHGARPPRPPRVVGYQPLPALGAVTLACNREAQALGPALAAAVRDTLAACSGACRGGGAGAGALQPQLRVQPVRMWLSDAIGQVLGALWRGEEEGGPGPDVGEMERLAWLLETIEGVRSLMSAWVELAQR